MCELKSLEITKIDPNTELIGGNGINVLDFWKWGYSDIMSNRNRGILAEFLVGEALGVTDKPRLEWDECDLVYKGKNIEVKTSAYLQSWY